MQKKADNQKYAEDKPKDCSYCYFWNSRKNGCSKEECYYRLLPEEPFEEKEETWCCEGCPYGKIFSLHRVLPAEDSAGNKTEESSQGEGR